MKVLTDRREMARALNFGKYPVLTYDIDNKKGSKAVVGELKTEHGVARYDCTLYQGYEKEDDGIFWLMTHSAMLTATVGVHDWLKNAEFANAPLILPNTEVAILMYSKQFDFAVIKIVKSGRIDPNCSTATVFTEID